MNQTFTDEQVRNAVRAADEQGGYLLALVAKPVPADSDAVGELFAEMTTEMAAALDGYSPDSGRHSYREYLEDQLNELDAETILDVLVNGQHYDKQGYEGVVEAIVAEVADLCLMDRDEWARVQDELARDAAVQAKIDAARGK